MGFGDIFKKTFLESFGAENITNTFVITSLLIATLLGIYIYVVYRIVSRRGFYSKSFNNSLVVLAVITTAIILTIQSSAVISLGMVGALSIVRFRTAIKDPMDLVFLFWSISVGIICGAGIYEIAVLLSVVATIAIVFLELLPSAKAPLLLVVNAATYDVEEAILGVLEEYTRNFKVKSRSLTKNGLEMIVELRAKNEAELVKNIGSMEQVCSVALLSHDGEVTY